VLALVVVFYAAIDGHWLLPELLREAMYNELLFYFYWRLWRGHTDTIVRACGRPGVARTLNTREEEEKRQLCH
jgi:uncharacterized membrane protein